MAISFQIREQGMDKMRRRLIRIATIAPENAIFDAVLQEIFQNTQELCPVDTGSLKNSGKTESESSKVRLAWYGYILYGGPSTPHDVDYVEEVLNMDEAHDFTREIPTFFPQFDFAMRAMLERL